RSPARNRNPRSSSSWSGVSILRNNPAFFLEHPLAARRDETEGCGMAMTPSAKKKLGALGIALVALAIDRGLIFSGGSNANAQAALGPTSATTPNATQQKNSDAAPAVEVASVLEALRETVAKHEPQRDAFRLPELLVPQQESAPEPIPSDDNDPAPQPHPEPSA